MAGIEKSPPGWRLQGWIETAWEPGDAAAWLLSGVIHLAVLLVLASATLLLPMQRRILLSALPLDELDPDVLAPQEFHFSADPHEQVGALGTGDLEAARPVAPNEADRSQIDYELEPPTPIGDIDVQQFDRTILQGPNLDDHLVVKGAGSVGTSGALGAVDRITHEILLSLDARPTLVVWMFDQSGSLKPQRESIAKRFDRIYDELGVIENSDNEAFKRHREQPLLTAIAQFGSSVELLTHKPTDELAEIKAAVRGISDDPQGNGRENVFQSVGYLAEKFRRHRTARPRRNVMIVVFTDEAGDDIDALDATIDVCNKSQIPIYVVGVPAPFGRHTAYVKYIDPDPNYDQSPQWAPVHQGPESLLPERVKLLFGGTQELEEQLDSGFGPFGLCRLAYETGGIYFTVHPNRKLGTRVRPWETAAMSSHFSMFFDPRLMRNYRPDYIPARQYLEQVQSNRATAALIEAARLSAITPMENVRRVFPRIDDAQFARDLSSAQIAAAKLEPKINSLVEILRAGEVDRHMITKPRWEAGFDLAIGRALAVRVRTEGYNAILAQAKQGLQFSDPKSDTWELRPADSITTGSALAKDADDARTCLERVVNEHAGTPWAIDAERELRQPLGWEWHERFTDVAGRIARRQANRGNNRPRPEQPTPPPKPRRDPPPL